MTQLIQTNHSPFPSAEKIPRKRKQVQARSEKRGEDTYLSIRKFIVQERSILLVSPRKQGNDVGYRACLLQPRCASRGYMLSFGQNRTCRPVGEIPARPLCEKARCSGYPPHRRIGQSNRGMVLRIFASAWVDPLHIHPLNILHWLRLDLCRLGVVVRCVFSQSPSKRPC